MPLEYYVTVFSNAYDFIESDLTQVEVLRKEYVTFSENLLNYIKTNNKGNGVEIKDFFTSDILAKQSDIKFGQDTEMIDISKTTQIVVTQHRRVTSFTIFSQWAPFFTVVSHLVLRVQCL